MDSSRNRVSQTEQSVRLELTHYQQTGQPWKGYAKVLNPCVRGRL